MIHLLLAVIYAAFISLGLPDSLLGAAWPSMYQGFGVPVSYSGIIFCIVSGGTVISSLFSDRLTIYDKYLTEVATLPDVSEARAVLMREDGSAVLAGAAGASLYLP